MLHFNKREYRRISAPNSYAMACCPVLYETPPIYALFPHFLTPSKLLWQNKVYRRCLDTLHPFNGTSEFFSSFRRLSGGLRIRGSDASRAFFSILPFQLADRISSRTLPVCNMAIRNICMSRFFILICVKDCFQAK